MPVRNVNIIFASRYSLVSVMKDTINAFFWV